MHKIFNAVIASSIRLPELPQIKSATALGTPTITFRVFDQCRVAFHKPHWIHHWYGDEESSEVAISIACQNERYLLRFPGLADFVLELGSASIQCYPFPDIPAETVRHLLLDQVIPRFMGHQGNLILHASATLLPDDTGIAFLGKSGWGKSTLASSFHQNDAILVTDDSLLLGVKNKQLVGTPAYAGARLWKDSAEKIFPNRSDLTSVSHFSEKKRLILPNPGDCFTEIDLKLIFLLQDPVESITEDGIKIERLEGGDAIMALIKRAFLLNPKDMESVARQFKSASSIAASNPVVYALSYQHDYDQLDELRAAILGVVNEHRANEQKRAS